MLVPIEVNEVMRTPVETVEPHVTARVAAERLYEQGIGSLVVCENGEPVGIVTDVDVTQLVSEGRDPEGTTVGEFMASPLVTTSASASLEEAAQTMVDHDIKRLPVVDGGEVVGIVTTTDLANYLPHLVRRGHRQYPDEHRERKSVRVDTAYEDDDWEFEYLGGEDAIDVGDTVRFSKDLSEEDVEAFAEASGDTNRLHLDADYAEATGSASASSTARSSVAPSAPRSPGCRDSSSTSPRTSATSARSRWASGSPPSARWSKTSARDGSDCRRRS